MRSAQDRLQGTRMVYHLQSHTHETDVVLPALVGLNSILYRKVITFCIELQLGLFTRSRKPLAPEQSGMNKKYFCYHPMPSRPVYNVFSGCKNKAITSLRTPEGLC